MPAPKIVVGRASQASRRSSLKKPLATFNRLNPFQSSRRDTPPPTQWPTKKVNDAPEVAILSKVQPPDHFENFIFRKLAECCGFLCRNQMKSMGLANLKPVKGRTAKTLVYVNLLATRYSVRAGKIKTAPAASRLLKFIKSEATNGEKRVAPANNSAAAAAALRNKYLLLKELYERAYGTLCFVKDSMNYFKEMLFILTFSKYAENALTKSELKQTRGKSIIGSCIWIITYALQQLQDDPEIELLEGLKRQHPGLQEVAGELQRLMELSIATWNEMVILITVIERMHKKTEDLFEKQTTHFQNLVAEDKAIRRTANLHIKKYRRPTTENSDWNKMMNAIDPYNSLLIWSRRQRSGVSRILIKLNYTNPHSLWDGFDPLTLDLKVAQMKDVLGFIRVILNSVMQLAQKITVALEGKRGQKTEANSSKHNMGLLCLENGLDAMDETMTKADCEWLPEEIFEFFEMDKIFLDDLDLLTLGAGVTRAILHDARHTMHVCYETSRLLDFKEFLPLPSFEKIHSKMKAQPSSTPKKGSFDYDIEEMHLELRNVTGLFRTSDYYDILKDLPVYCNRVGLTLQAAVFTPSSEKLLSRLTTELDTD